MRGAAFVFLLLTLPVAGWGLRADVLELPPDAPLRNVTRELWVWLDSGRNAQPEEVLARWRGGELSRVDRAQISMGYVQGDVWIVLSLRGTGAQTIPVVVELASPRLRDVEWVLAGEGIAYRQTYRPFDPTFQEHAPGRHPWCVVMLPPGEEVLVLARVRTDASILIPVVLGSPGHYALWKEQRNLRGFTHLGIILCIFMVSLYNGCVRRKRLYALMSGITFCYLLHDIGFHGYHMLLGLPATEFLNRRAVLAAPLIQLLLMQRFTWRFLSSDPGAYRLPVPLRVFQGGLLFAAVNVVFLPFAVGALLTNLMMVGGVALGAVLVLREVQRRRPPGWPYMLVCWWTGLLLILVLALQFHARIVLPVSPSLLLHLLNPILLFFFLLALLHQQRGEAEQQRMLLASRAEAMHAQLETLRYQLNPHFLFNSLNTIQGLLHEAPERIPQLLRQLSTFLRLRLSPSPDFFVPLQQELDILRAYLGIQQIRFDEMLHVEEEIDPALLRLRVPELLLQPLAENAVKFGLADGNPMTLRIRIAHVSETLRIELANTGTLRPDTPGGEDREGGIGLRNLQTRLRTLYRDKAAFTLTEDNGWVSATVEVPWEEPA